MMKRSKRWLIWLLCAATAICLSCGAAFAAEGEPAAGTYELSDDFTTTTIGDSNLYDSSYVAGGKTSHGVLPAAAWGGSVVTGTGTLVYRLAPAEGVFDTLTFSALVRNFHVSKPLYAEKNKVNYYVSADGLEWGEPVYVQDATSDNPALSDPDNVTVDLTAYAKDKAELYFKLELAHVTPAEVEAETISLSAVGIKVYRTAFAGTTKEDGNLTMTAVADDFRTANDVHYTLKNNVYNSKGSHGMVPSAAWGGNVRTTTGYIVYRVGLPDNGTFTMLNLTLTARAWTGDDADAKAAQAGSKYHVYLSEDGQEWGTPVYTKKQTADSNPQTLGVPLTGALGLNKVYVKIELANADAESIPLSQVALKLYAVEITGKYLPGPKTVAYEENYELDEAGLADLDETAGGFALATVDGAKYAYCSTMDGSLVKRFAADELGLTEFYSLTLTMRTRITCYEGSGTRTEGAVKVFVSPDGLEYTRAASIDSDVNWAVKSREINLSKLVKGWKQVYLKLEFTNPHANPGDWTAVGNFALSGGTVERSAFDILYNNVEQATHDNPAVYERGSVLTLGDASRTGYEFAGWYADADCQKPFAGITAETRGDVFVYAKWAPQTFAMVLDPNGGAFADGEEHTLTGVYDAPISVKELPAEPVKEGLDFVGWFLEAECIHPWIFEGSVGTPTIVDGSVLKLYAKYTDLRVNVTFEFNDGVSEATVVAYEKGQTAIRPEDPEREGYRFGGWLAGGEPYDFVAELTESLTLTAVWHKICALTYEGLEGGTHVNPATYVETVGLTLADAERVGYRFDGWFDNADRSGEPIAALDGSATGDRTLYAKWTVKEYGLTVQASHATVTPEAATIPYTGREFTIEVAEGYFLGEVTVNGTPVYVGEGKFTVAGIDGDVAIAVTAVKRNTLSGSYAVNYPEDAGWQAKVYESYGLRGIPSDPTRQGWLQVTPYDDGYHGGYLVYRLDAGEGKTFNTVKLSGYARIFTFQGSPAALRLYVRTSGESEWKLVKDFPNTTSGEAFTTLDENLTASVKGRQVVELRLELESGFTDWVCLRNLGIEAAYSTVIVKFMDGETSLGTNAKQVKGGRFTPLAEEPTKAGYEFLGWYLDGALQNPAAETVVTSPLSVYAKWRLLTYALSYANLEGAEHANPESYTVEDEVVLEPAERAGYKFLGWFAEADGSGEAVTGLAKGSTGERTLYAKWLKGESIVYELNGGVNAAENPAVYYADEETALFDAMREGYTFAGWYADAECTELVTVIAPGTAGGMTLYAKWIENGASGDSGFSCKSALGGGTLALGLGLLAGAGLLCARRRRD